MGRTLLDAMLRADGEALMLRVGEKPYVQARAGAIEIGTRDLPAHVVYAVFEGFFPPDARDTLMRTRRAHCVLNLHDEFPGERFTATAIQKEVLTLEVHRHRPAPGDPSTARRTALNPLILMIDDSEDQLDLYGLFLQDYYRVTQAGYGDKGIQLARAERPDVIVCDLVMPGLDGWQVCQRLKADPDTASIPVIILTASSEPGLDASGARAGAYRVLTKPCQLDALRLCIDEALDSL
jgi:CheY-like chemotaxis protein